MAGKKLTVQFFRRPRYYKDFSCIGGACPMSCCLVWKVRWSEEEIKKLNSAECSEKLKTLIDTSFIKTDEGCIVKMDENGRCPFLTEDNFCRIQREVGEGFLSNTCKMYPRSKMLYGNAVMTFCTLSCYRVMDILCSDKDCMVLENYIPVNNHFTSVNIDQELDIINHPELKYRHELFEFFYEIISDSSHSLETSVTLGALAAQSINKLIAGGAYDRISESLSVLRSQLDNPEQIRKLEELKPNYSVKLGFAVRLSDIIMQSDMLDKIYENGAVSIEKYCEGERLFREAFADRPFALRNIALNLLLELKMPFRDINISLYENYCYFAAALAAIKLVALAVYLKVDDPELGFKSVSSYVSRSFAHNKFKIKKVIDLYKELNCMSPAYIALILK